MKSVKYSRLFSLLIISLYAGVGNALAQQDPGYAPPPMFDDMTPPMVRPKTDNGYIVEPKASPNTQLPDDSNKKPIIVPRVSADPNSVRPAPAPTPVPTAPVTTTTTAPVHTQPVIQPATPTAPKMMQPIIEHHRKKPAKKPEVAKPKVDKPVTAAPVPPPKPAVEAPKIEPKAPEAVIPAPAVPATPVAPIAPEKKEETIEPKTEAPAEPVKRDPKESAIKGPKTMPALPTETIDEQKTFEVKPAAEDKTILERQQEEAKKVERLEAVVAAPKPNVAPAKLEEGAQGVLKKSIPFQQGQIGLSSAEIDPLAVAVTNELKGEEKDDWRLQIKAYATPYGTGVSSDKRIALSRALSLRSALIAQGVPAARIDVMAEGVSSDASKPGDRIDLYLYGPAKE